MKEQVITWALNILGPLVATALSWALIELIRWIRGKVRNDRLDQFLKLVENAAPQAIVAVERDLRPLIGTKLSRLQGNDLREEALTILKRDLGTPGLALGAQALKLGAAELDEFLRRKLDAAMEELKKK